MKKYGVVILALGLLLSAEGAGASADHRGSLIGIFGNAEATTCVKDFPLYLITDVFVVAALGVETEGILAATFLIEGVDATPADAIITQEWNSPITSGDALGPDGFSISFVNCMTGPFVNLGTLSFFVINPNWPVSDSVWCIVPTNDSGMLAVADCNFLTLPVDGWCFIANPENIPDCIVGTEAMSWGAVKALY